MTEYDEMKSKFLAVLRSKKDLTAEEMALISECLDDTTKEYSVLRISDIEQLQCNNADTLKEYLTTKEVEGCSDGTLQNYRYILRKFFSDCTKDIHDIEAVDIRRWLKSYKEEHDVTDQTMDKYREALSWFFSWCHAEGKISVLPTRNIRPIKHEEKERKALTRLELELLRGACKTTYERAVIETLYSTGFRVSELCNLKKNDINMRDRTVRTVGKGRKERTSWINAKCYLELNKMLEERDDDCEYVFITQRKPYGKCGRSSIERLIKKIQARIPDKIPYIVTPHIIRHSAATHALESGMGIQEIQKYLGHARIDTTMRYAHVSLDDVAMAHRKHVV